MIEFKKIRFKNLFSYGNNFTEIDFQDSPMTLISGKNGSGKSAIGEALTFGLFGVPFRNVNKPNIVNSINEKDCLVEIELCIGKKNYMIRRGIKPTIFEIYCDGKLIDQDSKSKDYQRYLEQNILKLNYKSFTQLVFLGSSNFVPFMQLTPQDRREVIEELLDIRVFSRMNVVLKEKQALVKEAIKDLEKNIDLVNSKLDIHKEYVESLNKKHEEDVKNWQEELSNVQKNHQLIENSLDDIEKDIQDKQQSIFDADKNKSKFNEYRQLELKLNEQLLKLEKSIEFYTSKNDCPTCNQIITNEFKEKEITKKKSKIETITKGMKDLQSEKDQITQRLEYITQTEKNILTLQLKQAEQRARLNALAEHIYVLNSKINGGNSTKTYSKEEINKYDQIQKEYVACQQKKDDAIETKHIYDIVGEMLKDSGIKSKIIKQYLPVMNKLINKYLNAMDFFVNFNIDENFQEIIKSRYRDEFEYHSFSQGQKFRIDMALLLTWREISRKKNSTNTNILILDEIFDSCLDAGGTEDFMKLLKTLSKKTNVFVISHKPDIISDKFDRHLKVEMKNNFSTIV